MYSSSEAFVLGAIIMLAVEDPIISSCDLARKAKQHYREMINAHLTQSWQRMNNKNDQAQSMPEHFHASVLERIKTNKSM